MNLEEKKISNERIYSGAILNLDKEKVECPDGSIAYREIVRHHGAACVLALTDDGKAIFVSQWREPLRQVTLEVPAGKLETGEDPKQAAIRELNEEVRIHPEEIKQVASYYTSPGFADEKMYFFIAKGLKPVEHKRPQDPGEFLRLQYLSLSEAETQIQAGAISDGKTVNAIWYWKILQLQGKV